MKGAEDLICVLNKQIQNTNDHTKKATEKYKCMYMHLCWNVNQGAVRKDIEV